MASFGILISLTSFSKMICQAQHRLYLFLYSTGVNWNCCRPASSEPLAPSAGANYPASRQLTARTSSRKSVYCKDANCEHANNEHKYGVCKTKSCKKRWKSLNQPGHHHHRLWFQPQNKFECETPRRFISLRVHLDTTTANKQPKN